MSSQHETKLNELIDTTAKKDLDLYHNLKKLLKTHNLTEIQEALKTLVTPNETSLYIEPILDPKNKKFTAFPIQHQNIWAKYKMQMASFWKAEELDFSGDYEDFLTLNEDEKHFIEMILAFFAASDGIVNFNLSERFIKEIQTTEIIFTYQYQAMMENIHCVSGNTMILTDKGYHQIVDILNTNVNVWNGKEFTDTLIQYTGDSPLYRVELSNGMHLDCTPEHKWFIRGEQCEKVITYTNKLEIGNVVNYYELPIAEINNDDEFKNPYIHGVFCGNGTYCNEIQFCATQINKAKLVVPINYPKEIKLRWLEGICDNDGCVNYNKQKIGTSIQLSNNDNDFLKNIQLMLTTIGIHTNVSYDKDTYMLYITVSNVKKLLDLGFEPKRLKMLRTDEIIEESEFIKVIKITLLDGIHKTYCFNESKEHAGIFNGILTGQSEVYSLMLDNIVKDQTKKDKLFNAIETIDSIKQMSEWAFKWIESGESFAHRVVAFVLVEGLFFQGPFAALFWLKKYKNKNRNTTKVKPFMCGLMDSNKFIARDEGQHTYFGCDVYNLLENKLSQQQVNEIFAEAVFLAKKFMDDAIPVKLIGMNYEKMLQYIEYIADRLLVLLGYKKIYMATNPFKFMETIGLNDKTNFFEKRPTEYQDSHIMNKGNKTHIVIKDDDDDDF